MFLDKKVVIFDLDGTLIDSMGIWNETDKYLVKFLSGNPEFEIDNIHDFRNETLSRLNTGNIYLNYCECLGKICGSSLDAEQIMNLRWEISTQFFKALNYKANAADVLNLLKDCGVKVAIATTGTKAFVDICRNENENIKKAADFDKTFSLIATREDVVNNKPSPDIYLKVMEIMGVRPNDCLVVEDALMGVQAANGAGIDVVSIYDKYSDADREKINKIVKRKFDTYEQMLEEINKERTALEKH